MGVVAPMISKLKVPNRFIMTALAVSAGLVLSACGDAPLGSVGERSSGWINEPTVPTTVAPPTTVPGPVTVEELAWANDVILNASLDDREAAMAAVFARREGDRFIQASRDEIAVGLADVGFPAFAPPGAKWITSQLVFNNDGTIADDPSAAFGIWTAEPYTRSRSVAQMIVLRVSTDPVGAEEAAAETRPSCARFADRTTEQCEITAVGERTTWILSGSGGTTLVWFDEKYRYELFGRSFVSLNDLAAMSAEMVPLASIPAVAPAEASSRGA